MSRKNLYLLLVIILSSLCCIIFLQKNINKIRSYESSRGSELLSEAPPIISFTTVALGGFRGIVADLLWLKTISLQDEGKYFELVQLASWIAKLQPKSSGAISFLAWNMAYNISIIYTEPERKWQWVENGILLLRNAIRNNPKNASLCKELAWIYINKIGDRYDSANLFYKTQLAAEMEEITGSKLSEVENMWNLMAKIPADYKEFIEENPNRKSISAVLENSEYKNIDGLYLIFKKEGKFPAEIKNRLASAEQVQDISLFLKRKMLKEEFGLDPEKIIEINKKFGELDWRLYSSFAVYWSSMGLSISKDSKECSTALNMALMATALNGNLLFSSEANYGSFTTYPNFSVFNRINSYFAGKISGKNQEEYSNFYFSFLYKAVPTLYLYGEQKSAQIGFDSLKNYYPTDIGNSNNPQAFTGFYFDNYFQRNSKEQVMDDISQYIKLSYLFRREKNTDLSEKLKNVSQYLYNFYSEKYSGNKLPAFQDFMADKITALERNL